MKWPKYICAIGLFLLVSACGDVPAPWIVRSKYIDPPESYKTLRVNPDTKEMETWCYTDGTDYILKARCLYGTPSFRRIYVSKAQFDKIQVGEVYNPSINDEYVDFKKLEIKNAKGKVIFKNDKFD